MRHPDFDYMLLMERRRDMLAAAKHDRMVKEAEAARRMNAGPQQPSPMHRLGDRLVLSIAQFLSAIGGWLLNMSCRLQTRVELLQEGITEKQTSPCA